MVAERKSTAGTFCLIHLFLLFNLINYTIPFHPFFSLAQFPFILFSPVLDHGMHVSDDIAVTNRGAGWGRACPRATARRKHNHR